jgi:hypothetical protein
MKGTRDFIKALFGSTSQRPQQVKRSLADYYAAELVKKHTAPKPARGRKNGRNF